MLHLNIWYVNIIEISKEIGNGKLFFIYIVFDFIIIFCHFKVKLS